MRYKHFHKIFLILFLLALMSCQKYEQTPVSFLTNGYVYNSKDKNGDQARKILNHLYTFLPSGFNRIDHVVLGAATDDAIPSAHNNTIEILAKSRLTPFSGNPDTWWYKGYSVIRQVNSFLDNINKVPIAPNRKKHWKAEARFIRAINYFELIKRYGGVPLVGNRVFSQTDNVNIPRSSYDQCVQYIISELSSISDSLRTAPVPDNDIGRITKGAALALKAKVLLYAASPLNNPDDNKSKWQIAANAAKDVIDLNTYKLSNSFYNIFIAKKRKSPGLILAYQRAKSTSMEHLNAPVGYGTPNRGDGYVSPTQELVNAFPMKNGLPIDDPASGYDPQHPYKNRDPRLQYTVFYNGSMWLKRKVETFEGGLDKPNDGERQTRTGYYMRKFLFDYSNVATIGSKNHLFPIFRYAGILFDYAEASNEIGQTGIAYDQLKKIRKRAGIEAGPNGMYGLKPNMTQDEMRKAIRLERRIEMAFEQQRYWDVRRWKIADQAFNKTLHGIKIKKTGSSLSYQEIPVDKIIFKDKMYRYPIPHKEVAGNPVIKQNPKWK
jgi:hypothetical protein